MSSLPNAVMPVSTFCMSGLWDYPESAFEARNILRVLKRRGRRISLRLTYNRFFSFAPFAFQRFVLQPARRLTQFVRLPKASENVRLQKSLNNSANKVRSPKFLLFGVIGYSMLVLTGNTLAFILLTHMRCGVEIAGKV